MIHSPFLFSSQGSEPTASSSGSLKACPSSATPKATPTVDCPPVHDKQNLRDLEEKRKRLLNKVELAKQGWTGVASKKAAAAAATSQSAATPADNRRKPIGDLPGFISLSQYSSDDEEDEATETKAAAGDKEEEIDERLI